MGVGDGCFEPEMAKQDILNSGKRINTTTMKGFTRANLITKLLIEILNEARRILS